MCFPLEAIAVHFNGSQRSAQGWANCPTIRARFISPESSQARGAAFISFSLQRGRGAPFGATSWSGTFERCRLPCDRQARLPALHLWRFSSRAALPGNRTDELSLRLDPGGLTCPTFHPGHVQPSKAAPSCDGAGGDPRRPGILVCVDQRPGRHTLLRQIDASRWRPLLNKACPEYRVGKRRKDYCDLEC